LHDEALVLSGGAGRSRTDLHGFAIERAHGAQPVLLGESTRADRSERRDRQLLANFFPMKRTLHAYYYLPLQPGRRVRRKTVCQISEDEAAARGLTDIVPGTANYIDLPETAEERARALYSGASAVAPRRGPTSAG
jgi:hypothetical protein